MIHLERVLKEEDCSKSADTAVPDQTLCFREYTQSKVTMITLVTQEIIEFYC